MVGDLLSHLSELMFLHGVQTLRTQDTSALVPRNVLRTLNSTQLNSSLINNFAAKVAE